MQPTPKFSPGEKIVYASMGGRRGLYFGRVVAAGEKFVVVQNVDAQTKQNSNAPYPNGLSYLTRRGLRGIHKLEWQ